jgi:hypothetical protein
VFDVTKLSDIVAVNDKATVLELAALRVIAVIEAGYSLFERHESKAVSSCNARCTSSGST